MFAVKFREREKVTCVSLNSLESSGIITVCNGAIWVTSIAHKQANLDFTPLVA